MIDIFINASALGFQSCLRHYQLVCQWGYPGATQAAAEFGSAFHKFAEAFETTKDFDILKYFAETQKTIDKTLSYLCIAYQAADPFNGIPPLTDKHGTLCLEYKFCVPYMTIKTETESYRILVCGTIDRIDIVDGCVRIIDRKTSRNIKIKDVLFEYELHLQIPFYLWAIQNLLISNFDEDTAKLITNEKLFGQYHGIFLSFNPPRFELGNIIPTTTDMNTTIPDLIRTGAETAIFVHSLGAKLAPPTGMAHKTCKHCSFQPLCITRKNDTVINSLKFSDPVPYNPMTWR